MTEQDAGRIVAQNRKARHDYVIEDTIEAGVALLGTEVKSLRQGGASIGEAYAGVQGGELFLLNAHVPEYEAGHGFNHQPRRARKLLLHRRELDKLERLSRLEGHTLVPLRLYLRHGRIKCEIAVAKGKKLHDKRQAAREETARREARDALGRSRKGR